MEGNTGAGIKGYPGNTGQMVSIVGPIALIGHVDAGPLVIRAELAQGSFGPLRTAGTACDEHRLFIFECSCSLGYQVDINAFFFFRNVGRERDKLILRDDAHLVHRDIKRFASLAVRDFVPEALFLPVRDQSHNPMCG